MLVTDTFARVLGAIGTITGVIGAIGVLIGWLTYQRDRPNLNLNLGLGAGETGFDLDVTVVNKGYRPVALTDLYVGWGTPAVPPPNRLWRLERRARSLLLGWWLQRWPTRLKRPPRLLRANLRISGRIEFLNPARLGGLIDEHYRAAA